MKCDTTLYVSECDTYQKVNADYMKPRGLLQPLSILEWKWDDISMDFIMGLPLTTCKFDPIWVIVDRLSKSTHFIPVNTKYRVEKYVKIYITVKKKAAEEAAVKKKAIEEVATKKKASEEEAKKTESGAATEGSSPSPASLAGVKRAAAPSGSTPPAKRGFLSS
jgi:hypothetical protein